MLVLCTRAADAARLGRIGIVNGFMVNLHRSRVPFALAFALKENGTGSVTFKCIDAVGSQEEYETALHNPFDKN